MMSSLYNKQIKKGDILVLDDEPNAVKVLSAILSEEGYDILSSNDAQSATQIIHKKNVDTVITDIRMPGTDGMQFFEYLSEHYPEIPVIFLTAYGTVESAVYAMNQGAYYYFIKPPDYPKLKNVVARSVEQHRMKKKVVINPLPEEKKADGFMIGSSPEMVSIFETIDAIKDSTSSILICGETGTGKEVIARAIHCRSNRKERPFIGFNCAAIPRELVESELFGYEKGAFTGAMNRRIGRFEEATHGTILLDEIGELELSLQAKLLRVLQEKEVERLGSNQKIKVDFRLISSTNRDLKKEVEDGKFREDLYYRINVIEIKVPPLKDRPEDISLMASEFLDEFCRREHKSLEMSREVMDAFRAHPWPGNVRQIRNVIERSVVLAKGEKIMLTDLPEEFSVQGKRHIETVSPTNTLRELEVLAVKDALSLCNGNKSKASKMLGISRKAFYKRLKDGV